jgi:hypothetical protein
MGFCREGKNSPGQKGGGMIKKTPLEGDERNRKAFYFIEVLMTL